MRQFIIYFAIVGCLGTTLAGTLEVGKGKPYSRIEDAVRRARSGDTILVCPPAKEGGYDRTAVYVTTSDLTFKAQPAKGQKYIALDGKGFNYSGRGSIPRAIFQFNRGADRCVLEGFELSGAVSESHNGAGVRINQANGVIIRGCSIHNGIMSNGEMANGTGADLLIERCAIFKNGTMKHPGYNHNLYLGGTSVTLRYCDVHHATTGHNVKSRAHYTRVEYCFIHDSANREFDLVDAKETEAKESHAVLLGNVIIKDPKCRGNKAVIHFGQDGGRNHNGTVYLVHNTIITPFISPVVHLSAPDASAVLIGNLLSGAESGQRKQVIILGTKGAKAEAVRGENNWFGPGWSQPDAGTWKKNTFSKSERRLFPKAKTLDFTPSKSVRGLRGAGATAQTLDIPKCPGVKGKGHHPKPLSMQYKHPLDGTKRKAASARADIGALAL